MSMNLHCEEMDLWQTPTHITYMCFYDNIDLKKQALWIDARSRYAIWIKSTADGVYDSQEECDEVHDRINSHLRELYKYKKLNFFIM